MNTALQMSMQSFLVGAVNPFGLYGLGDPRVLLPGGSLPEQNFGNMALQLAGAFSALAGQAAGSNVSIPNAEQIRAAMQAQQHAMEAAEPAIEAPPPEPKAKGKSKAKAKAKAARGAKAKPKSKAKGKSKAKPKAKASIRKPQK